MFGWKWKYPTQLWHRLSIDEYSDWELEVEETPAFVKLTHVRGDVESADLAIAWDDVAETHFYQRDWTESGIPFVSEGETYWSGWWFQSIAEKERFEEWVATTLPRAEVVK